MYVAGMLLLHDCLGRWNGVYLRNCSGHDCASGRKGKRGVEKDQGRAR